MHAEYTRLANGDIRLKPGVSPSVVKNAHYRQDEKDPTLFHVIWPPCQKREEIKRKRIPVPSCTTFITVTICGINKEELTVMDCKQCKHRQP